MKESVIHVAGSVLVTDILAAIEDAKSDGRDLTMESHERISFDDVEVLEGDAAEELDEDLFTGDLADQLDEGDVRGLAEAVRIGDRHGAEVLLDRLFGHNPRLKEWLDRGRYSGKARALKAA